MGDEIGRVEVHVTANLSNLAKDLRIGETQVKRFSNTTTANASQAAKSLNRLQVAGHGAAQAAALITGPLGGVASRMAIVTRAVTSGNAAIAAFTLGLAAAGFAFSRIIRESEKFDLLGRRTVAVLKATGYSAGLTADEIKGLSNEIDRTTLANRDQVEQAAQMLLTFRSVAGDTFKEALRLSQDLAEVGFGTISSSAVQMGKALEDPVQGIAALRRVGVSFTATQKEQIKNFQESGRLLEAQKIILKAVKDQVGGAGAGAAGGLTGAIDALSMAWSELLERLGNAGPFKEAAAGLARLTAQALDSAGKFLAPTDQERFDTVTAQLQALKAERDEAQRGSWVFLAPGLDRDIELLEKERNRLGELIQQTESLAMIDRKRAKEKSEIAKAEADAERKAEAEKALAPARAQAAQQAASDELSIIKARNQKAQSENDLAYQRGEKTLSAYYATRRQLTEQANRAEIEALEKKKAAIEGTPAADKEGEIAKAAELASVEAEIQATREEGLGTLIDLQTDLHADQVTAAQDAKDAADDLLAMENQIFVAGKSRFDYARAQLDEQLAKYREIMALSGVGDSEADRRVAIARDAGMAQIALDETAAKADQILNDIAVKTALIGQQAEQGLISEAEARRQIIALQAQQIPQLDAILVRMEELQRVVQTPEGKQAIDNLKVAIGGLRTEVNETGRVIADLEHNKLLSLKASTSSLFRDMLREPKNWRDHLINFFDDIANAYAQMAADMMTQALFQGAGNSSGGGGSIWGQVLGNLVGGLAGAFGGGGNYFGSTPKSGGTQHSIILHGGGKVGAGGGRTNRVSPGAFINAPRFHRGVMGIGTSDMKAGLGLRPNEHPAVLETGETVVPAHRNAGFQQGTGRVVNNYYIQAMDVGGFMRSKRQVIDSRKRMGELG